MNHQPYETWILDQPPLTDEDRLALNQHLETCQACRKLNLGFKTFNEEIAAPVMLVPRPGFSRRWKASLAERRAREQRRQAWRFFLIISAAALAILLGMVIYTLATSTPAEVVQIAVRGLTGTVGFYTTVRSLATTWLDITPIGLNIVVWIAFGITFCLLSLIWVFAVWRTALTGVMNK